jgi:hypothetical protein
MLEVPLKTTNMPSPYYKSVERTYDFYRLKVYLDSTEWKEGVYVENKFDCSEMSAYIERELENMGYHTLIVVGDSPDGQKGEHCWLLVELKEDNGESGYMPIEATQYWMVLWNNPYFQNYFKYKLEFETIYDALAYNYDEFNWWENY